MDIWNRLQALQRIGVSVDLVLTVKRRLPQEQREAIEGTVQRLVLVQRQPLAFALAGRNPVQMGVRSRLRTVDLSQSRYDVALLDNEFCGEILHNRSLNARRIAVRVQNDEEAYQRRLADTAHDPLRRLYFGMEARRMASYIPRLWRKVDALWFISSNELSRFNQWADDEVSKGIFTLPNGSFLPAGLDLNKAGSPRLGSRRVLFVGTLAVSLNQDAIRWYLAHVHTRLLDEPGYEFVVAGSTLGEELREFRREMASHPRVSLHCDVPDLGQLFAECGVFVSPMRFGAGVKLKTVEAALRGLPLVSTSVGAEGSGLVDGVHCRIEDEPAEFAAAVRELLHDAGRAEMLRTNASTFICQFYDQAKCLKLALEKLDESQAGLTRS